MVIVVMMIVPLVVVVLVVVVFLVVVVGLVEPVLWQTFPISPKKKLQIINIPAPT